MDGRTRGGWRGALGEYKPPWALPRSSTMSPRSKVWG